MAYGIHGSYSWNVSKGSCNKACLTELQMRQWTAKWDYLFYWLFTDWVNGINAFILFFSYTFLLPMVV
jgi:hypothetical protein